MTSTLRPALVLFLVLSLITGIAYPLVMTGLAKATMPFQAGGSIVERDGKPVGSLLIGGELHRSIAISGASCRQRPLVRTTRPRRAAPTRALPTLRSSGRVKGRTDALRAADPDNKSPVPVDLATAVREWP